MGILVLTYAFGAGVVAIAMLAVFRKCVTP